MLINSLLNLNYVYGAACEGIMLSHHISVLEEVNFSQFDACRHLQLPVHMCNKNILAGN